MTLQIAPNRIEASDFSAGFVPDLEDASLPPNGLLQARNVLPNIGDGAIQVRQGYAALNNAAIDGYTIRSLHPYNYRTATDNKHYLIAVATLGDEEGAGVPDNVRVYAYDLDAETWTRISPSQKTWQSTSGFHYGFTVGVTYYGGSEKDPMYSWNPNAGWTDDVTSHSYPAFIDDKAYRDGSKVSYTYTDPGTGGQVTSEFKVRDNQGNWHDGLWKSGHTYTKGDRRRHRANSNDYWKVYKCIKKHKSDGQSEPGVGANWDNFWKIVDIANPVDGDGNINSGTWSLIPDAPETSVAVWHGNRVFARNDSPESRKIIYSASIDPESGKWDPKDWSVGGNKNGPHDVSGGGYFMIEAPMGDIITGLHSFGDYLLIFTTNSTWVLTGTNPEEWYLRPLAPIGCVGPNAVTESEGLVYFFSYDGLYYTDGTLCKPVPGLEAIREWFQYNINLSTNNLTFLSVWSFDGYIWVSLPTNKDAIPDRSIVYDPNTQSWWPQTLAPTCVAINRKDGVDRMFFALETDVGNYKTAVCAWEGARDQSKSTRTIAGVTERNHITNPSFEADRGMMFWDRTSDSVKVHTVTKAARFRKHGLLVENAPSNSSNWQGIKQDITGAPIDDCFFAIYCRRPHWHKHKKAGPPAVKALHNTNEIDPDFEKVGRGWYRAKVTLTITSDTPTVGWVIKDGTAVEFDACLLTRASNNHSYFDGSGSAPSGAHEVVGGGTGRIFQYGWTKDANGDVDYLWTDDGDDYGWSMQTAWFPFGTVREERRIRRLWVVARGQDEIWIHGLANYKPRILTEASFTLDTTAAAKHIDGAVGDFPAATAVSVAIEGDSAPAAVQGVGIDTQVRRAVRFRT